MCHGPARVLTRLRLHGCTHWQLPAVEGILWSHFGRRGSRLQAAPWRCRRAVARHHCFPRSCPSTSPPQPCPAAPVAWTDATRPDSGQGGLGPASTTAPGRRRRLGPAPPARAPLGREAGWSNGRPIPCHWAIRQCAGRAHASAHCLTDEPGIEPALAGVLAHRGLLAVRSRGPAGRVCSRLCTVGDGSRTSEAAGGSPAGCRLGQTASCKQNLWAVNRAVPVLSSCSPQTSGEAGGWPRQSGRQPCCGQVADSRERRQVLAGLWVRQGSGQWPCARGQRPCQGCRGSPDGGRSALRRLRRGRA
jgi:hypothetical protein